MADASDSAENFKPDAKVFRRAGLTQREADRLASIEHARSETRAVWESSFIGLIFWCIWKLLYKGFQPAWIIASLALSGWFAVQIVIQMGGISALTDPELTLDQRVEIAVSENLPDNINGQTYWHDRMNDALDGDYRHRPDIELFRTWAAVGPDLIGRDNLAIEILSEQERSGRPESEALIQPVWEREIAIETAYNERMEEGVRRDLAPSSLIFAPEAIRHRYETSLFSWSIAQSRAHEFFLGQTSGQLELTSLPGLVRARQGNTRLYGGVRHLVIQTCAYQAIHAAIPEDCLASIIPAIPYDATGYRLAALESGLVTLSLPASAVREASEVLTMARASGRLHPELANEIAGWLEDMLPEDLVTQEIIMSDQRLDLAFSAPQRANPLLAGRIDLGKNQNSEGLSQFLNSVASLRRMTSPTRAVRILEGVKSSEEMEQLLQLSVLLEERFPGLQLILGEKIYELLAEDSPRPVPEERLFRGLYAGLISAAMVLLLSMIRLSTPILVRRSSRLKSVDANLSRLFLGRKT